MRQIVQKDHPLVQLVNDWKKKANFKSETIEEYVAESRGKPLIISYKIDGELTGALFDGDKIQFVSREGKVREDFSAARELADRLKGKGRTILIGELYAVDERGEMLPYPQAMSILRKPTPESEERIRFAVIDIKELDGKPVAGDYWDRFTTIAHLLPKGDKVKPVSAVSGDITTLQEMWDKGVMGRLYEGLVVYEADGSVVKIKPIMSQDLAVIAVERSKKHPDIMGALHTAYMDQDKNFRYAGKVGTGFTQEDRREWMAYAQKNKIKEDGPVIWIKPDRVIEVVSKEFNIHDVPVYNMDLERVEDDVAAVGREPRYRGIREDKSVNPDDLRLEQIPGWENRAHTISLWVRTSDYPKHPDTVIIRPNEWYPDGLTEAQIWEYYDAVKTQISSDLMGAPVLVITSVDGGLVRRKDPKTGRPIEINSPSDFDALNNGRNSEFHRTSGKETDRIWVDLDPKEAFPWKTVLDITERSEEAIRGMEGVRDTQIRFSGGKGFHVYGFLEKPIPTDIARKQTIRAMEELVAIDYDNVTTGQTKDPNSLRLDVSTLHDAGSLRAEWSMNSKTGLVCVDVKKTGKNLKSLDKSDFTIDKVTAMASRASLERISYIVKRKDGYYVLSEKGKNLGGPYKTREQAKKRLRQIEFFKHKKALFAKAEDGRWVIRWIHESEHGSLVREESFSSEKDALNFAAPMMKENLTVILVRPDGYRQILQWQGEKVPAYAAAGVPGGLAKERSIADIARLHKVPEEKIKEQIDKGTLVEFEHVVGGDMPLEEAILMAIDIAKDHLIERPDYYDRLAEMEKMEVEASHKYGCAMVYAGDKIADVVRSIGESIPDVDIFINDDPEDHISGREDEPHITVKWGLHTDDPDEVRAVLRGCGPIKTKVGGISMFEQEDRPYDVLKFDIDSEDLHRVNKLISDNLEHTDTHPEYRPHMTIAYLKKGRGKDYISGTEWGDRASKTINGIDLVFDTVCYSDMDDHKTDIPLKKSAHSSWVANETEAGWKELVLAPALTVAPLTDISPAERPAVTEKAENPVGWRNYDHMIGQAASSNGIHPDILERLLKTENAPGDPSAVSSEGAVGLAQLMPSTATEMGVDPKDPEQSIHGAAKYLKKMYDQFGDWEHAVMAYNWGPRHVQEWIGSGGAIDIPSETKEYVKRILTELFPSMIVESSGFKFDPNSTENEGRWRLRDPKKFDQESFKRWKEWAGVKAPEGITFIVGDLEDGKKAIQTIRFDKSKWDEKGAGKYWESVKNKPGFEKIWTDTDWTHTKESSAEGPGILIGTSGFKYKHWSGAFYPSGLPRKGWLSYYSSIFPTVEISSTFHQFPEPRIIRAWCDATPDGFLFSLRAPRRVTHDKHLVDTSDIMSAFARRVEMFGDKLGGITFQLMESEPFDRTVLEAFLDGLPSGFRYSMEFRSEPWHNEECREMLTKKNIASVIVGHSNIGVHTVSTSDWSYIRLSGNNADWRDNSYTDEQLMNWRGILADAKRPAFVYFNNEFRAHSANNAKKMMDIIGERWKPSPSKTERTITPQNISPNFFGTPTDPRSTDPELEVEDVSWMERKPPSPDKKNEKYVDQYPAQDW